MHPLPLRRRVAITGMGIVSPAGVGPERLWQAVVERRSLISRLTRFDASTYPSQIAGQVDDAVFDDWVDPRKRRNSSRVTRLALAAAALALREAQWTDGNGPGERGAVLVGTALGGWFEASQQSILLVERGARRVNPFIVNGSPNHAPGAEIAAAHGFRGPQLTFSNGCPAGLAAVTHAADLIAHGVADICLAGGVESPLTPLVFAGMGRTGELSTANEDPTRASRPFDCGRAGMVLSEGAGFIVLEAADHAVRRGAPLWGEVSAGSASCDAAGLYDVDATGAAAAAAITQAMDTAQLQPEDVSYVCSHANGAAAFEHKESAALRRSFGDRVASLPVSSIKGVTGHPFAAAGIWQLAIATLSMRHRIVPPTANLDDPDPACTLQLVAGAPLAHSVRHALVSSYGYGGLNGYVLVGHPDGLPTG